MILNQKRKKEKKKSLHMQSTCDETGKDTMVKDFLINYNLYNLF